MASLFLRFLRTTVGILFVAMGFLAGVICLCGTGVYTWAWFTGGFLTAGDRRFWMGLALCGVLGGGIFAAGRWLLGRQLAMADSAFSPAAGARQRNLATGNLNSTFIWPLAAVLWYGVRDHPLVPPTWAGAVAGGLGIYAGFQAFILCHELGHLGAAFLVGMQPQSLQVGTGPRLLHARLGGVLVEFRALLGGGMVRAGDTEERGWRRRRWLFIAGGPALHGLAVAALGWWLWRHVGAPEGSGWRWLGLAWQGDAPAFFGLWLLSLAGWTWVFAIVPRAARFGAVQTRTDGSWLLRVPRLSQAAVRQQVITGILQTANALWEQDRRAEAWEQVRRVLARYPGDSTHAAAEGYYLDKEGKHAEAAESYARALGYGGGGPGSETATELPAAGRAFLVGERFAALVRAGEPEAARRAAAQALETTVAAPPSERAELLDALASQALQPALRTFLPEADGWTQEMIAVEPDSLTRLVTRGAVLVDLGRFDEAEPLLRQVWTQSRQDADAALSALGLGLIARARGQGKELRHWQRRATGFTAVMQPWFAERVRRELDPEGLEAARPITPLI